MHQSSFFEVEYCYARLDKKDPLLKMQAIVNWEGLGSLMSGVKFDAQNNGGKGGRRPFCGLMMAKVLILQALYNLSDETTEFMIEDRFSFKRFLGLDVAEKSPDAKTIWLWRERVKHAELDRKIFAWFDGALEEAGYAAKEGQIIDATFVPTHKPTGKQERQLKKEMPLTPRQAQQADPEASFTKKGDQTYHGYKNHTVVDAKHKLIRRCAVTTASLHDSQMFAPLIVPVETVEEKVVHQAGEEQLAPATNDTPSSAVNKDGGVWADSAYRSAASEEMLAKKGLRSHVCERAYRNTPLTEAQKASNHLRSKTRVRVEHVYGHMATSMGGLLIHTMGLARASVKMTLKNLTYNMQRFVFLELRRKRESGA